MMSLDDRSKCANQIAGDVAVSASSCDGIPEYPAAILEGAVRSLVAPALFNALYHRQQFERLDIPDRILFEPGK